MNKKSFDYLGENAKTISAMRLSEADWMFIDAASQHHSNHNLSQELRIMVKYVQKNREDYFKEAPEIKEEMIEESVQRKIRDFSDDEHPGE
jgi:signal recognition particle GTPase